MKSNLGFKPAAGFGPGTSGEELCAISPASSPPRRAFAGTPQLSAGHAEVAASVRANYTYIYIYINYITLYTLSAVCLE